MNTYDKHSKSPSRILSALLWIVQLILTAAFGMAGVMKAMSPISDLAAQLGWPGDIPPSLVRCIGVAEFLGAVGVLLPSLLRIKPILTIWASIGLMVIMVFAMIFHIYRGELFAIPINITFGLLAAFVAWGRSKKVIVDTRKL
jgi:putative oxidoreductase